MTMTLSEKIIARAAGLDSVTPGDIVTCAVDLAMMHDSSGPRRAGKMLDLGFQKKSLPSDPRRELKTSP